MHNLSMVHVSRERGRGVSTLACTSARQNERSICIFLDDMNVGKEMNDETMLLQLHQESIVMRKCPMRIIVCVLRRLLRTLQLEQFD